MYSLLAVHDIRRSCFILPQVFLDPLPDLQVDRAAATLPTGGSRATIPNELTSVLRLDCTITCTHTHTRSYVLTNLFKCVFCLANSRGNSGEKKERKKRGKKQAKGQDPRWIGYQGAKKSPRMKEMRRKKIIRP